ncbi:carboxy terminal-processing peptidase [Roseiconus lacunae]|uniref:Carboxy terminal-processing peptidase n=1 Tax=Roseiconus lacunae TaxID=2605694 RepID=A0ABT7PS65_9BACT|nr:carboxy terminal-processing peptidase [Roseiconus lacunae]MCD0459237.1 carboxy terminal-processing peptidase [Roseiconus lacunae]MDM4019347.1 carboxy terminal-processing peptidase [Roseiconus lacunae]WRQ53664.1 carboxy terminal-processing peptidase [Stieleria sp. HD01]
MVLQRRLGAIASAFLLSLAVGWTAEPLSAQETPIIGAAAQKPSVQDRLIAKIIAQRIERFHISGDKLNDDISQRALDLYIERFDPLKLYFYQSDVDEFQAYRNSIDDFVKKGDLNLAYKIFKRYTERVDERVAVALELLDGEFDYTKDEYIVVEADETTFAKTPEEARERWRRQIKYTLLDLRDSDDDDSDDDADASVEQEDPRSVLRRRYQRYARRFKTYSSDDLLEAFLTAVTSAFDPHSSYMSPTTYNDFLISMRLKLQGIGAALREKDGKTVVMQVIPGGAADLDKRLQADDIIVSVGQGDDGPMVDIVEMPLKEVVSMIRGNAGTIVRLGVKPGGKGDTKVYKIKRANVELATSAARGEVIDHKLEDGTAKKIGFINLPSFYMDMDGARENRPDFRSSTRDVRKILLDFKSQGVEGVVIDLSRNGGGSLTEAINLTGLFIDRGPVVQVKDSNDEVQQYNDEDSGTVWSGPLVVLTSKFSASASEIFAGAIQDYHRGIIVGDPATHGKGTVQTLMNLAEGLLGGNRDNFGALKVTLQQFYLPDGKSTQRDGVSADIILPSFTQNFDVAEGDLQYALEADRINGVRHDIYKFVPAGLLNELRQKSETRVQSNEEFLDRIRRIALFVKQKEESQVPLNEEKFLARRKQLDAQKEQEKEELNQQSDQEVFRDDFYNREVLNITSDYIAGLQRQQLVKN